MVYLISCMFVIFSIFIIYSQILFVRKVESLPIIISVLFIIYAIFNFYHYVDEIIHENGEIILKKKLKDFHLKDTSSVKLIYIKMLMIVYLKIKFKNGNNIIGWYIYSHVENKKLISLLNENNIDYNFKTIWGG